MINPAMKNLQMEITNGCATFKPILVAVDADAHKTEKVNPINIIFQVIFILSN